MGSNFIQILKVHSVNSAEPDQTLVLRCLPMSHKKEARLKWVNRRILDQTKRNAVKPALSDHFKGRPKISFQDRLLLNAGQKYCRMLQEHSAIQSTSIKLPFVFKTFVLSIFEWPLKTGFTVPC